MPVSCRKGLINIPNIYGFTISTPTGKNLDACIFYMNKYLTFWSYEHILEITTWVFQGEGTFSPPT